MFKTIPQLSKTLQQVLTKDADRIGRESGFIQRERKFSGGNFAQTLVFGWQANPKASLEELCQSARVSGVEISPQGLQERLNSPQANTFLKQLLAEVVSKLGSANGDRRDLLSMFNGVYIQDSSKIKLPDALHKQWQGNTKTQAALKIHAGLDYQKGLLDLTLAPGRKHDSPLQTTELPKGCLRLADLGYFNADVLNSLSENGVWWVSRVPARAGVWLEEGVVHLAQWLDGSKKETLDQQIELTAKQLPCRLVAIPVSQDVAEERRRRVREAAKARRNSTLKTETLLLCDWTLLITNLPADKFSADQIVCLQRLRWQIELLFKLWKSELFIDEWRTQQPHQIMSEVYAKLIVAVIQHWLLLFGCWQHEDRSLFKASKTLRKHAFQFSAALSNSRSLTKALRLVLPSLSRCKVQKRKKRPATFQLLERFAC